MQDPLSLILRQPLTMQRGGRALMTHASHGLPGVLEASAPLTGIAAGSYLGQIFQVRAVLMLPVAGDIAPAARALVVEATTDISLPAGEHPLPPSTRGLSLAWITMSDKGSKGLRQDQSGPLIAAQISAAIPLSLAAGHILPDDAPAIRALITDLALLQGYDLIVTTGGTGLAPRDVTADVTGALVEKRLYGFEQLMLQASLAKTPHGAISRAVAGTLGLSLIINLPGSPKAVAENLAPLLPAIPHALAKLKGDPSDCARP